jgi:hypothetical protein
MAALDGEATAWGGHWPSVGDAVPRSGGSAAGVEASHDGGRAAGARRPAAEVTGDL